MYKLLIVDDNNIQIQSVMEFINWEEFGVDEIVTAQNGVDALKKFKELLPDIVITDVVMPLMNGIEFQQEALRLYPKSKFIFMSCYNDFDYLKTAMENKAISYILKPINSDELEAAIKNSLGIIESEKKANDAFKLMDESIDVFRENLLYRFLYSKYNDVDHLHNTIRNLKLYDHNLFITASIEIGETAYFYKIIESIKGYRSVSFNQYIIIDTDQKIICVFTSKSQNIDEDTQKVYNFLRTFISDAPEQYNTNITAGVSMPCKTLVELPKTLLQADAALEEFMCLSLNGVCIYENKMYIQPSYKILELKDSLASLLDDCTDEKINSFLDIYYPTNMLKTHVKLICTSILTTLQILLLEKNIDIQYFFGDSDNIYNKLNNLNTHYNLRQLLFNIIKSVNNLAQQTEKCKYSKIIDDIKKIVDENYSVISNIDYISEQINLSTSYVKNIFKKYTGETIFDYLLRRRMEAAKLMLKDPYVKVFEVADKVGYKSKAHFSETFRKYTGMTPRDFQKNIK